jgi:copper chaperone CopZ
VERTVGGMDGVMSCEVNLAKETAKVLFDAAITTPRRIIERIQQMGYEAQMMG